ncbi:hypothetical protein A2382_00370 [Candidatus Woesebacteria bacterium RIFOXYB1_FULL_38_16]|uniref:Response regulatory domain-containing protein n=1 Tax=Candidatus Woesebacteria bacterium RIFOXYB1_FULL_38_16 TaxID=1802538 RepID=A0A1F8CUI3_9BACT|nr:MAG: hypothetical protein A2191_01105 [Candidatus Woesebacteria bacterium RIFOXYA1_FULL_38_9]OGM79225.1 MAG: hypothetical protein A2382_00370 [Candidatus Woesebacteria bacterium RIFOXYB1_FULL_38_16]
MDNKQQVIVKSILIIEDDPMLQKMYKTKFESEGFLVWTASDGETGLNMALAQRPSIVLLDIMMPKLSGMDMLIKLRADLTGKTIPVVMLTNLSQQEEVDLAMQLGVKEYLVKANNTPGEVVEKVKKHIQ